MKFSLLLPPLVGISPPLWLQSSRVGDFCLYSFWAWVERKRLPGKKAWKLDPHLHPRNVWQKCPVRLDSTSPMAFTFLICLFFNRHFMLKPKTSKLSLNQTTITKFEFGWSNLWTSKGKASSQITNSGVIWQETGLIVPGRWQLIRRDRVTRTGKQGYWGEPGFDNSNKMDEPLKSHTIGSEGFWRQEEMSYIVWALMSETPHCRLEFQWVTVLHAALYHHARSRSKSESEVLL